MYQPPEQPPQHSIWDHQWNNDETIQSSVAPPPPYYPPPYYQPQPYQRPPQKPSMNRPLPLIIVLSIVFLLGFSVYVASAMGLYDTHQPITYDNTTTPDVPTATSIATVTNQPTTAPTQAPTQPLSSGPAPTSAPHKTGVNGNPWGYDFNAGQLIYSPPADFCAYFACIANFGNSAGYVIECQDGQYATSGGLRGSCSRHGGDMRPLYSHPAQGASPCITHQFALDDTPTPDVTPSPDPKPSPKPSPEVSPTAEPSPTPQATPTIPVTRTPEPTATPQPTQGIVVTPTPAC